jgi:transposase InsO family protein
LARWAASYNQTRPHSALGYLTPATFVRTFTATADRRPTGKRQSLR